MDSTRLTRQQADRLRLQVASRLRWLSWLVDRMQRVGFPPDDAVFMAALRARDATQAFTSRPIMPRAGMGSGKRDDDGPAGI